MRKLIIALSATTIVLSAGYSFAQSDDDASEETTIEMEADTGDDAEAAAPEARAKRGPVDLERFSRLDNLKAADKDGDGTLSREELEAHALARIVERRANRMERRLDITGDGAVTIEEIEKHRAKQFAALDRNEDGQLDRKEMRMGKQFRDRGQRQGRHHGTRHEMQRR